MQNNVQTVRFNTLGLCFASVNLLLNIIIFSLTFIDKSIGSRAPIIANPFLWNFPSWILAGIAKQIFHVDAVFYTTLLIAGALQWYAIGCLSSRITRRFKRGFVLNRVGLITALVDFLANLTVIFLTYAVYGSYYRRSGGIGWIMIYPLIWNFPSTIFTTIAWKISHNEFLAMTVMIIGGAIQWYALGALFSKIVGFFSRLLRQSATTPADPSSGGKAGGQVAKENQTTQKETNP